MVDPNYKSLSRSGISQDLVPQQVNARAAFRTAKGGPKGVTVEKKSVSFFGDASSKDSAFMVLGGLVVRGSRQDQIETKISQFREDGGISSEFHWKDYRGGARKPAYGDASQSALSRLAKLPKVQMIFDQQF